MKMEKLVALTFFVAMGGMFPTFAGMLWDSDLLYRAGLGWALFFGAVMLSMIIYHIATSR